jgi:DNA-binding transcriptional regulator PaaX
MSRPLSAQTLRILKYIGGKSSVTLHTLYTAHTQAQSKKEVYDSAYRLEAAGLVELTKKGYEITPQGALLIHTYAPKRDGIWKFIVYDIPESKRGVRVFLRQRLRELKFKKWQNSIWVSPYELSPELERELLLLAQRYFVRLIKTTDINYDADLKRLFPD